MRVAKLDDGDLPMDQSILHCADCGVNCTFIGADRLDALRLASDRGWRLIFDEEREACSPLFRCGVCDRRRATKEKSRFSH